MTLLLVLSPALSSARVLQQDSDDGGFLADELPLKILVTTPSNLADNSTQRLMIRDKQALTVRLGRACRSPCTDSDAIHGVDLKRVTQRVSHLSRDRLQERKVRGQR